MIYAHGPEQARVTSDISSKSNQKSCLSDFRHDQSNKVGRWNGFRHYSLDEEKPIPYQWGIYNTCISWFNKVANQFILTGGSGTDQFRDLNVHGSVIMNVSISLSI